VMCVSSQMTAGSNYKLQHNITGINSSGKHASVDIAVSTLNKGRLQCIYSLSSHETFLVLVQ
jgi:hypothetical protein